MIMRARFGVALFAGLLLGLIIVLSAAYSPYHQAGATPYLVRFGVYPSSIARNQSGPSNTTDLGNTTKYMNGDSFQPALASQIASIGRQPPAQSAVVLLPVLAAVFFGLVLYRASAVRNEEKPSTGP